MEMPGGKCFEVKRNARGLWRHIRAPSWTWKVVVGLVLGAIAIVLWPLLILLVPAIAILVAMAVYRLAQRHHGGRPFLWSILTPLVTVPASGLAFALLAGTHSAQEVGLPEINCGWFCGPDRYFEVQPTILVFTVPGLLNLGALAWVFSRDDRTRAAAIFAAVLGLGRAAVPVLVLLLGLHRVSSPLDGRSYFEYDSGFVGSWGVYIIVWFPGFIAWLLSLLVWGGFFKLSEKPGRIAPEKLARVLGALALVAAAVGLGYAGFSWLSGGEPAAPATGRIAFASCHSSTSEQCSIYLINADGSGERRLTHNEPGTESTFAIAWSPDGGRLAFVSYRDGNHEIYVINADGAGLSNLTNNPASDYQPAWSPDGRRIAFMSGRDLQPIEPPPGTEFRWKPGTYGSQQVYVMDADGSDQTRLTENKSSAGGDFGPAWSPDGGRIALTSHLGWEASQVQIMKADGSDKITIGSGGSPVWSPDGSHVAFDAPVTYGAGDVRTVYVVDPQGSGLALLARDAFGPAWSPDSSRIAFTKIRMSGESEFLPSDIFVMNSDGSDQTRLTEDVGWNSVLAWSPDATRIAFIRLGEIYVMDADGSNVTRLTNSQPDQEVHSFAWSPVH